MDLMYLFQGIGTFFEMETHLAIARVILIFLGIALVFLGAKNILEPLVMVPMGFGMAAVNAGMLFLSDTKIGTLVVDPLVSDIPGLISVLQIDFLQPVFTFAFSNNLIACIVFMGVGVLCDVGYLLKYPFTCMLIALFAELGTIVTYPIAIAMGLPPAHAAAAAIVGTADGPLVLFSSLMLAPEIFVPITVIAYLYLSLTYAGYPYIIKAMIPKEYRGAKIKTSKKTVEVSSHEKLVFSIVGCTILCLLLPAATPLLLSFFLGVAIRESGITKYVTMIESTFLYAASFFLGLMLGVLCDANTILNPVVAPLLFLGILALTLSAVGGVIGGYFIYFISGKNFNPTVGIAAVSCVPSTAKIAQKEVSKAKRSTIILQWAMGANICGVLTSAILMGIYITVIPMLGK